MTAGGLAEGYASKLLFCLRCYSFKGDKTPEEKWKFDEKKETASTHVSFVSSGTRLFVERIIGSVLMLEAYGAEELVVQDETCFRDSQCEVRLHSDEILRGDHRSRFEP